MYEQEKINPYSNEGEKHEQVEVMFDNIAPTYDTLNHTLSLGTDKGWRRKAIDRLGEHHPHTILDIATGTGDFAILAAERLTPHNASRNADPQHFAHKQKSGDGEGVEIIGADLSEGMMAVGREKVRKLGLDNVITFQKEDCLHLSFEDNRFDAVTVAYGVRNFQDLEAGLSEMLRVLKPGGHLLILELATPPHFPMKQLFWLYSHVWMPLVGRLISKDKQAYKYLPATMEAFPQGEVMEKILYKVGYSKVEWKRFTFGICTMYLAEK
ncbi:MAG: bifunctional demethylmenaquinone methyltransferase/2-methoxy-6-polyprenyl-1,4-benzoquinol methylase UbiE [Bacteroidaceae bacterium]|nr:bifunctional demethylmenaquinone methyltransferase/2-methoxy-6-polyprenyl-1,4-benzoquinol methylase UbiE [Bacteroidaceae bacterium]